MNSGFLAILFWSLTVILALPICAAVVAFVLKALPPNGLKLVAGLLFGLLIGAGLGLLIRAGINTVDRLTKK